MAFPSRAEPVGGIQWRTGSGASEVPVSGRPRVAHRMNVNLTQRGWDALQESVNLTGDSMTDTVNRALQAYAFFRVAEKKGQSACLWDENSGQITRLNFL